MSRLGYRCDGANCSTESAHTGPPAVVRDDNGNWKELCIECYEIWTGRDRRDSDGE